MERKASTQERFHYPRVKHRVTRDAVLLEGSKQEFLTSFSHQLPLDPGTGSQLQHGHWASQWMPCPGQSLTAHSRASLVPCLLCSTSTHPTPNTAPQGRGARSACFIAA